MGRFRGSGLERPCSLAGNLPRRAPCASVILGFLLRGASSQFCYITLIIPYITLFSQFPFHFPCFSPDDSPLFRDTCLWIGLLQVVLDCFLGLLASGILENSWSGSCTLRSWDALAEPMEFYNLPLPAKSRVRYIVHT